MNFLQEAEQNLRDGDVVSALKFLQEAVKSKPADAKLRIFLFQLLSVLGQWDRALNQLNVLAEIDVPSLAMVQTYREALRCELLRTEVFAGKRSPMVFGQPEQWLAFLIESLLLAGQGRQKESIDMHKRAFDEADATSGLIEAKPFVWIADADSRLGPVVEAVINGRYYWVPFSNISKIHIEKPEDLRDCVWMPAHFQFVNGGESVALIPTRYAGTEKCEDPLLLLARKTEWDEVAPGIFHGFGQRLFSTDGGDVSLMDIRQITLDSLPSESQAG